MNNINHRSMAYLLTIIFILMLVNPVFAIDQREGKGAIEHKGLQQRIDFGNSQILGQSIKSGAVYLMHRKKSDIKNMIQVRDHYRNEIKEDFDLEKTAIARGDTN